MSLWLMAGYAAYLALVSTPHSHATCREDVNRNEKDKDSSTTPSSQPTSLLLLLRRQNFVNKLHDSLGYCLVVFLRREGQHVSKHFVLTRTLYRGIHRGFYYPKSKQARKKEKEEEEEEEKRKGERGKGEEKNARKKKETH